MSEEQNDEWSIHIDKHYIFNDPGQSARDKERELAGDKSLLRQFAEKVFDPRTADRSWRRGAEGEEEVGRELARLPRDRWAVVHDLTIGSKGANLDHS